MIFFVSPKSSLNFVLNSNKNLIFCVFGIYFVVLDFSEVVKHVKNPFFNAFCDFFFIFQLIAILLINPLGDVVISECHRYLYIQTYIHKSHRWALCRTSNIATKIKFLLIPLGV